jgi:hypothetical protein
MSDLGLKFLADPHIASRVPAAPNVSLKGTHVNVAPSTVYSKFVDSEVNKKTGAFGAGLFIIRCFRLG